MAETRYALHDRIETPDAWWPTHMAHTWGMVMTIVNMDIPPNKPRSFGSKDDAVATAFAGS